MAMPDDNNSAVTGKPLSIDQMKAIARKIRRDIITMIGTAGSGHPEAPSQP